MPVLFWLLLSVSFAAESTKNSECRVACLWAGYDTGTHQENSCWCADRKSYEVMTRNKRLNIGKRPASKTPAPSPTYQFSFP